MSNYKHRFVSDMAEHEQELEITRIGESDNETDYKVDGHRVIRPLYELCSLIRQTPSLRHLHFGLSEISDRYRRYMLAVFDPTEVYTYGWVGYGDFSRNGGEDKWVVRSPNIVNNKYAYYTDQYHQKLTNNKDRALAAVKQYIRPYTDQAIADATVDSFVAYLDDKVTEHNREVKELREVLESDVKDGLRKSEILQILSAVLEGTGKIPEPSDRLRENFNKYTAAFHDYESTSASLQYRPTLVFCTRNSSGGIGYKVIPADSVFVEANMRSRKVAESLRNAIHNSAPKLYDADTLPSSISGKLAVLSMLENSTYIAGTGFKYNDRLMYVMASDADA